MIIIIFVYLSCAHKVIKAIQDVVTSEEQTVKLLTYKVAKLMLAVKRFFFFFRKGCKFVMILSRTW